MNRNPHDAAPRWRRRLALIAGACGMFLLNLAFVALPVAADGHGNNSGRHDGQGVEAQHNGADMDNDRRGNNNDVDMNDDRGQDVNDADVNDDRGQDVNDNDANDDRGNDANDNDDVNNNQDNDDAPMMVLIPKTMTTGSGR